MVHLDNLFALLAVGLGCSVLHILDCIRFRNDLRQLEECGLKHGVDAGAESQSAADVDTVNGVELDVVLGDKSLHLAGNALVELFAAPRAVQQESTAVHQVFHHVILVNVGRIVAGNEVRVIDQVGGVDGGMSEAQMRNGYAARLFGVIGKVSLCIHVGVVADNLNGVLVGANRTVGAETPELTGGGSLRSCIRVLFGFEGQVGHVVFDTDGELRFAILSGIIINSNDLVRSGVFGTKAVTSAKNRGVRKFGSLERCNNIQIERFAQRAGLLGSVKNGNGLNSGRNRSKQTVSGKRTIEANLDQAGLSAVFVQEIDGFIDGFANRAHRDDDVVGIGSSIIVEQGIVGADFGVDLCHILLNDFRNRVVVFVAGLARLEEDIRVLGGSAQNRMLRIQSVSAECVDCVVVNHLVEILVIPNLNLLELMGGTETVEEVEERNTAFNRGTVRNCGQVHNFLNAAFAKHRKTGLAACINVGMVAENVKRMGSDTAGRNVDDAREQLARHFIHVRNHQQEALRSGIGGGECTGGQ